MNSEVYLRREAVWDVRASRYLVLWATGLEGLGGNKFVEYNRIGIGAMGAAGSIIGGGSTLGSGTTLGGVSGGLLWTGKLGIERGKYGTSSGVGVDRVVDGIQLENISQSL